MKRFKSHKKGKVSLYKLRYILVLVFLFIIMNFLVSFFLKKVDQDEILDELVGNSFGNVTNNYNLYNKRVDLFYRNIFGFPFKKEEKVISENDNLNVEEFIVEEPIIYLYNTFQTTKYKVNYFNSYNVSPVITQASLILQEYLREYNINSIVEASSVAKVLKENNLAYTFSYRGSRILMEAAKEKNQSLNYFFDIQLSQDNKEATTVVIDNLEYAKVLFVVGTDNANNLQNQELAKELNGLIDSRLSRGISLRGGAGYHGVYNQDFSSNALLIQVGGEENTIDEVNRTLKVLAESISEMVGDRDEKK